MPSQAVHLKVAYLLINKLDIKNQADFYLGSISPDAVNLNGFASQEIRYSAHIRNKDYNIWKENIKDYYHEHKSDYLDYYDFFKGFILHLYTDIAWDEEIQPMLFEYLISNGYSEQALADEKWKELFRLNHKITSEDWYEGTIKLLNAAKCHSITTVSADLLDKYRNYVVNDYKDKISNESTKFLNNKMIELTAGKVLSYMSIILS